MRKLLYCVDRVLESDLVLETQMETVNLELKRARTLANKWEIEARAAERHCKDQESRNHLAENEIERDKAEIPRLWKRLEKESDDFKTHKRDRKKGRKRLMNI
ncbi:hypothetical protein R1flu_010751 [Riccia fluitans]|uniref:Uncharacterized protein n=1 Tax=Riccia fluitans TaxID=41844 RepID=A0ABD1Z6Y2_9MARC